MNLKEYLKSGHTDNNGVYCDSLSFSKIKSYHDYEGLKKTNIINLN